MNTYEKPFTVSAISLAVRAALVAMVAVPLVGTADDAVEGDVQALISPTNYVELGAMAVSDDSSKFGEFSGLNEKGGYLIGNILARGGDAYGMGDGLTRWEFAGSNLGTTSGELGVKYGRQGKWSLGFGYDAMRHYVTNGTYETPFQGSMGGNTFTLPSDFGVINVATTKTGGVLTSTSQGTRTLTDHQLSYFHNEDVYTERDNTTFAAGYDFNPRWNLRFDFNHLDQSGAKLIGSGTDAYNPGPGGFNYRGERVSILMNPTNYQTDTFNLGLNWVGDNGYASATYAVSLFHDDYRGLSWSNPFVQGGTGAAPVPPTGTDPGAAFPVDTMSTPPSNQFHQLNLTGGYIFSPMTKLSGGLSYSRNTQDESFAGTYTTTPDTVPVLPVNSLDGLVVATHLDVKLTHQASKALGLTAGVRYDERDNKTPSYTYTFLNLGGDPQTVVNTPMSNRRYKVDLGGDYRLDPRQRLHFGYELYHIKRWCNNALANNAQGTLSATNTGYYTTASCVQVPEDREDKLVLKYKKRSSDSTNFNVGYSYAKRKADVNSSFYNPMQANEEGFEDYGYLAYFDASRTEQQLKAGVNWQPSDKVTLGINGRLSNSDYDSTLGVQNGSSTSVNLDATYAYRYNRMVAAYLSWQHRKRDLLSANERNAVSTPANPFSNKLTDDDVTLGLNAKQTGFWSGRLKMKEELTYSLSKTGYSTAVDYTLTGNAAIGNLSYGDLPDIKSEMIQLKVTGDYQLDKNAMVRVGLVHQKLNANDYFYNAYQYGYTATSTMPSNQGNPSYTDDAIFATYQFNF